MEKMLKEAQQEKARLIENRVSFYKFLISSRTSPPSSLFQVLARAAMISCSVSPQKMNEYRISIALNCKSNKTSNENTSEYD